MLTFFYELLHRRTGAYSSLLFNFLLYCRWEFKYSQFMINKISTLSAFEDAPLCVGSEPATIAMKSRLQMGRQTDDRPGQRKPWRQSVEMGECSFRYHTAGLFDLEKFQTFLHVCVRPLSGEFMFRTCNSCWQKISCNLIYDCLRGLNLNVFRGFCSMHSCDATG